MAIAFVNIFKQDKKKVPVQQFSFILHVSANCQQHMMLNRQFHFNPANKNAECRTFYNKLILESHVILRVLIGLKS